MLRRRTLARLGRISALLSWFSIYPVPVLPALFGLPLGFLIWKLARRDQALMRAGQRNPRWLGLAIDAEGQALDGMVVGAASVVFWGLLLYCVRHRLLS